MVGLSRGRLILKLKRKFGRLVCVSLVLTWLVYFTCPAEAIPTAKIKELKQQAQELEKKAHWGKACSVYAKVLELQADAPGVRDRYFYCLRRYLQECRHSDPSYLKEVLALKVSQSERLYEFI